jgi:hypothetical protein
LSTAPSHAAPVPDSDLPAGTAAMDDTMDASTLPTSFGSFNPVGHLMVGLPTQQQADRLVLDLHGAGWAREAMLHFRPQEAVTELQALVDNAGVLAGFGYEITLLRRYLALAKEGYRWLLVKVDDDKHAATACDAARACGATLAVHYRALTVEELI